MRLRGMGQALDRWDTRSSAAIAGAHFPDTIDHGLPLLTRLADRSVLWMGIGAALWATGDRRAHRAAARGISSIALTSLLANQVAKRITPRHRPDLTLVPTQRVAHRVPVSSSFPSGHSASAAAFALGVGVELPPLALPVGLLAAAVGFSRVYTGVHFPTDVLAGAALGTGVAALGTVLVPVRPAEAQPEVAEPSRPQPPRPSGQGVVAVINPESGGGDGRDVIGDVRSALPDAQVIELPPGQDPEPVLRTAAADAEVLAVGGGDGTVCAAARAAMDADVPLLVLPAGTFNHFAKDAGLPEPEDALAALRTGRAVRVDVGEVDGELFLNTASLGSYPEFVHRRERWQTRLGKPLAAAIAIVSVLRHSPPLAATVDGVPRRLVMLFVGNGAYEPRGLWPRRRERLDTGKLDVRFVDAPGRIGTLGLLAMALSGGRTRTARLIEARQERLDVHIPGDAGQLARDGEISDAAHRAHFSVRRQALTVYRGPTG